MEKELELQLQKEFPEFFRGLHNGDPRQTLMCFGLETGDGWYNIVYNACQQIKNVLQKYNVPLDSFVFVQIKEKFGSYRLYFDWQQGIEYTWWETISNKLLKIPTFILKHFRIYKWWNFHRVYNKVDKIIRDAEMQSGRTCEDCGAPSVEDKNYRDGGWIVTLCQKHLDEYYSRLGKPFDYGKLDAI